MPSSEEWLALDQQYRFRGSYDTSVVLVRGEGIRLWDADGRSYLDFESGQVCTSTGHGHPRYTEAIIDQARTLVQTGSGYTNPPRIELAQKLAELMPGELSKSFFACTGSESNEAALRIARTYTGRSEIASIRRSYHGMTQASLAVTGMGGAFRSAPGTGIVGNVFLPPPYAYRCPFAGCEGECNLRCADEAAEIIQSTTSGSPAAIIVEVIISAGGMIIPSAEYVQAIRQLCDDTGALMIVDEAQTGLGRTGRWFAVDHFGVVPDIVTTSKSLGGGIPLSGVTTTPEIEERCAEQGFKQSSSHTDDPFLCAVGLANIEIIEQEGLVENAARQGEYLKDKLLSLQQQYEIIGDVRGLGLMLGIEIVTDQESKDPSPELARSIGKHCNDNGLLLGHRSTGTLSGNNMRLLPPLNVTRNEADEALAIIEAGVRNAVASR